MQLNYLKSGLRLVHLEKLVHKEVVLNNIDQYMIELIKRIIKWIRSWFKKPTPPCNLKGEVRMIT